MCTTSRDVSTAKSEQVRHVSTNASRHVFDECLIFADTIQLEHNHTFILDLPQPFFCSSKAFKHLPLNPMNGIIHPQINIFSVTQAKIAEEIALANAFNFFGLNWNSRHQSKLATFRGLHQKFIKIGLLRDLDWNSKSDKDLNYIKLCLARAEKYRQSNLKQKFSSLNDVKIDDLPLGPLEFILFKPESFLEHLLNNRTPTPECCVCGNIIKPTKSVLFPCECFIFQYCSDCAVAAMGAQDDTYHGNQNFENIMKGATIQCPLCRIPQYYTIRNAKEAIKEEARLISDAFDRLIGGADKKKRFTPTPFQALYMKINEESIKEGWVVTRKDIKDVDIMLKDPYLSIIKCDVARLQVSILF